jgi:hypothetical protein
VCVNTPIYTPITWRRYTFAFKVSFVYLGGPLPPPSPPAELCRKWQLWTSSQSAYSITHSLGSFHFQVQTQLSQWAAWSGCSAEYRRTPQMESRHPPSCNSKTESWTHLKARFLLFLSMLHPCQMLVAPSDKLPVRRCTYFILSFSHSWCPSSGLHSASHRRLGQFLMGVCTASLNHTQLEYFSKIQSNHHEMMVRSSPRSLNLFWGPQSQSVLKDPTP